MEMGTDVVDLVKFLGPIVLDELIKHKGKSHGSKVKEGAFKVCKGKGKTP